MKDEIKEILDFLKVGIDKLCISKPDFSISYNDAKILLDCIIDLQDTLKDREEYCYGLETQITNLQEENERLRKNQKLTPEQRNHLHLELDEILEIYKSRNEKALDKLYCYGEVFDSKILQEFQKEMENILNGGD